MKAVTTLGLHDALLSAGIQPDKASAVIQALETEMFESLVSKQEFRSEMSLCKQDFKTEISLCKQEFRSEISRLEQKMDNGFADVRKDMTRLREEIVHSTEKQTMRLTVQLGVIMVGALTLMKLLHIIP